MEVERVVSALSALAQETRLQVFRELVKEHVPSGESCASGCTSVGGGLAAGELAKRLGVSASSLSFHLKEMQWNELVSSRKEGRSVIYSANLPAMQGLLAYLLEDCCGGACGAAQWKT
ncbi:MAG: helix-turn-helix domain-containing protein [Pseudomonadales bacterium]|nr:helix-turn-helix domain-containing protein [Pseudomonadales bacterium]